MSDPLSALALAAGKRVLWRTVLKVVAWCLPVVLVGVLVLVVYASVLAGGEDADGTEEFGVCGGVKAPAARSTFLQLDPEQIVNAQTIAAVGRRLGVPARGLVVALATAMQESTLHNLPYGDRDSVGLFQQRTTWGSRAERMDPATASELFFTGGRGGQPGLVDISGYLELPVAVAAQAVQRSAFPDAYAKWEVLANSLLQLPAVAEAACVPTAGQGSSRIVEAAKRWLGTPYSWGGGSLLGPSLGIGTGSSTVGFDCSGLTRYAVYAATGRVIPRVATDQATALTAVPLNEVQAGDLLFFHDPEDPEGFFGHVGIADGAGGMVHAPTTGSSVEVMPEVTANSYWGQRLLRAGRA